MRRHNHRKLHGIRQGRHYTMIIDISQSSSTDTIDPRATCAVARSGRLQHTIRYDTIAEFNVDSKAEYTA